MTKLLLLSTAFLLILCGPVYAQKVNRKLGKDILKRHLVMPAQRETISVVGGGDFGGGGGCSGNPVAGTLEITSAVGECPGDNSATLTLSGYHGTISWWHSANGTNFVKIADATGPTYIVTDITATTYYRVAVKDGTCNDGSNIVVIPITSNTYYLDGDGDGYGDPAQTQQGCSPPDGYVSNNGDCNDREERINPQTVWYKDADGDGWSDGTTLTRCTQPSNDFMPDWLMQHKGGDCNDNDPSVVPLKKYYRDEDGDGFGRSQESLLCSATPPQGYASVSGDCNDANNSVYPDAEERCDGLDNDCDGETDEGFTPSTYYKDGDLDGYGGGNPVIACSLPVDGDRDGQWVLKGGDCNDHDRDINPGEEEILGDGIDNNCDGLIDPPRLITYYLDNDGDGYGAGPARQATFPPAHSSNRGDDCDDTDRDINPGELEVCDNKDNDCDGEIDEGATNLTWYLDADQDGYGDPANSTGSCVQPDGYVSNSGDCNDANNSIHEEGRFYFDADGDGYHSIEITTCNPPLLYKTTTNGLDCNDQNGQVYPGAAEVCDGIDNNCDGQVDEGFEKTTWYRDEDGDGQGDPGNVKVTCYKPEGYIAVGGDCNDQDRLVYQVTIYIDQDGDGYDNGSFIVCERDPAGRLSTHGTDCNDNTFDVHAGAPEICDGLDNDCDGEVDEGLAKTTWYIDADEDGYGDPEHTTQDCKQPLGYVSNNSDCNDDNRAVHELQTYYLDGDGDGYHGSTVSICDAIAPAGYKTSTLGEDCRDDDKYIHPGATEIPCDDKDNDCNGQVDDAVDNVPPVFTCSSLTGLMLNTGITGCNNDTDIPVPVAADNCGAITGVGSRSDGRPLNDPWSLGNTTVTWKFTDQGNNSIECTQTVTVLDRTLPVAKCKNQTLFLGTDGQVTITPELLNDNSYDNCGNVQLSISKDKFILAELGTSCAKTFTVTLTVKDQAGNTATCVSNVTVRKRPLKVIYDGPASGQYSDVVTLSAKLLDSLTGQGIQGTALTFALTNLATGVPTSMTAITASDGKASGNLLLNPDPQPDYNIKASFAGNANYCAISTTTTAFDIKAESICAEYNGQLSVAATVLSKTSNTAKVAMSVGLLDANDGKAGDVTKAIVDFNYDGTWRRATVQALNTEKTMGIATLVYTITFSGDASTLSLAYRIGGYYQLDPECSDDGQTVINIYKPQGEFITGGGYILPSKKSVGTMPADSGRKANFGFNVKYNQKNTNLQGNINYVFRRKENGIIKTYQVKGNSMTSLTVNLKDGAEGGAKTAIFTGKCNVSDITNPLLPVAVSGTGNSLMQVIITDAGEPGTNDKYGITVWSAANQLLHSSNWESTKTTKLVLRGGNIVVNGSSTTVAMAPPVNSVTREVEEVMPETLEVKVLNNPSSYEFTAIVKSKAKEAITMIITDANGRKLEIRNGINVGHAVRFGTGLKTGIYFCEFRQGAKRKVVKLVKS